MALVKLRCPACGQSMWGNESIVDGINDPNSEFGGYFCEGENAPHTPRMYERVVKLNRTGLIHALIELADEQDERSKHTKADQLILDYLDDDRVSELHAELVKRAEPPTFNSLFGRGFIQ